MRHFDLSPRVLATLFTTAFIAAYLAACATSKPAVLPTAKTPESKPAQPSFFQSCGHAPLRLVYQKIRLLPVIEPKLPFPKSFAFSARKDCGSGPCFLWAAGKNVSAKLLHEGEKNVSALSFRADVIRGELPRITGLKTAAPSVLGSLPIRKLITRSYADVPEIFRAEEVVKKETAFTLHFSDRDFTVNDLRDAVSGHFTIEMIDTKCPLTKEEQETACSYDRIPLDPSEGELSYCTLLVDRDGAILPDSKRNRSTKNIYRLFDALTRAPCPGWKIQKFTLNARRGNEADESMAPDTRSAVKHLVVALKARAKETLTQYAEGGDILFESCVSLQSHGDSDLGMSDLFMNLGPQQIPLSSVRFRKRVCTSLSGPSPAGAVPQWMESLVSAEKEDIGWVNPRFAIPLAPVHRPGL